MKMHTEGRSKKNKKDRKVDDTLGSVDLEWRLFQW